MCVSCNQKFPWKNFKKCIESAPAIMPYPIQIEKFGKNHHAIGGYQKKNQKSYEWQSYVSFGTRYQIYMGIPVMLNKDHSEITKVLGEPEFHLIICGAIKKNSGGGFEADIDDDIVFTKKEWLKMIEAKGDIGDVLAVLDVKENKNPLLFFDDMCEVKSPPSHQVI